jgi:HD-like signal output (HDOD) protein/ActR/RegA family two-component response regulator
MVRVLFVDDEPQILQGLRRMLRPLRDELDAEFAEGGAAALEALATGEFDAVVSDMRMPGVDGLTLLEDVRTRYPQMARIVLSGYSEQETLLRVAGLAHQYLAKPCDADALVAAIRSSVRFRGLLENHRLRRLVVAMHTLPSLPDIYYRLLEELRSRDPSIERVGELIGGDVAMTAKILQLVNSAFFGLPRHLNTPAEAARYLGTRVIHSLVLTAHVFSHFERATEGGIELQSLWDHSQRVGRWAAAILAAEGQSADASANALIAGMLHDVGKVVLIANVPETYAKVLEQTDEEGCGLLEVERRAVGATHAEVGAYLLGLWAIPEAVVETLAYHHEPSLAGHTALSPLTAVHVADIFAHEASPGGRPAAAPLDEGYLAAFGGIETLDRWRSVCGADTREDQVLPA